MHRKGQLEDTAPCWQWLALVRTASAMHVRMHVNTRGPVLSNAFKNAYDENVY